MRRICDIIVHVGPDNPAEFHCIINQQELIFIFLNEDRIFGDIVVLTVDRMRRKCLNQCQFQNFVKEVETAYEDVFYNLAMSLPINTNYDDDYDDIINNNNNKFSSFQCLRQPTD